MIKEAIEKILSLAPIQTMQIGEHTYTKDGLVRVDPPKYGKPSTQVFHTLSGLIDFTKDLQGWSDNKGLLLDAPYFHISDENQEGAITVTLKSSLIVDAGNIRFEYAQAKNIETGFKFGSWYLLEDFIVAVMSQFVPNGTISDLIDMLGSLANEAITENKDDKFSQTIQVRTGITTRSTVKLKNPMPLQPFRTFREVDQPESQFVFRLRNTNGMQCALFESDGGAWKIEAIKNIKAYLAYHQVDIPVIG